MAGIALAAVAVWHYWPTPDVGLPDAMTGQASETSLPSPPLQPRPPVAAAPPSAAMEVREDAAAEPALDAAAQWEAVKRYCPWPPDPSSWSVLDERCLSAMNAIVLDAEPEWQVVMDDPSGTRLAVVAALDDPLCQVPPGESRPDLYEACAAEAMVRLARLQRKCLERAHTDWEKVLARADALDVRFAALEGGVSQEEYIRDTAEKHTQRARVLFKVHMCRSAMDALVWLEALPRPPGDLANAGRDDFFKLSEREDGSVAYIDVAAPRLTQDVELFALAHRLGAKLPDWADWVADDPSL